MTTRSWLWLLPIVPVLVGVAVVTVAIDGGDEAPAPVEIVSSAANFSTVEELVAASDLVVVGTVAVVADGRQITAPDDPEAAVFTRLLTLDVVAVLAGSGAGDVIVEEPATLGDGAPLIVDGMIPLDTDQQAIWFLVAGDAETMPYYAVVNRQGRYTVAGETLVPSSDDSLSAELARLGLDGLTARVEKVAAR